MRFINKILILAIPLAFLIAYGQTLELFFAQDDWFVLESVLNPTPENMTMGAMGGYFRPVALFWFPYFLYILFGLKPLGYHVVMVGILLINCILIQNIVSRDRGSSIAGIFAACLYGTNRMQLNVLGWISGSCEVLSMMFALIGIYMLQRKKPMCAVIVMFALALLGKESFFVVVAAVALSFKAFRWPGLIMVAVYGLVLIFTPLLLPDMAVHFTRAGFSGFDFGRSIEIWLNTVISFPFLKALIIPSALWIALLCVISILFWKRSILIPMGIWLVFLGGILYTVTEGSTGQPFQLYYSHFCILGVCLLAGALASFVKWKVVVGCLLIIIVLYNSVQLHSLIQTDSNPQLHQDASAFSMYTEIKESGYTGLIIETNERVYAAIGYGRMIDIMFPDKEVEFILTPEGD